MSSLNSAHKMTFVTPAAEDPSSGRVLRRRSKRQSVSASTASSLASTAQGTGREKSMNVTPDTKTSTMKGTKRVSYLLLLQATTCTRFFSVLSARSKIK